MMRVDCLVSDSLDRCTIASEDKQITYHFKTHNRELHFGYSTYLIHCQIDRLLVTFIEHNQNNAFKDLHELGRGIFVRYHRSFVDKAQNRTQTNN